MLKRHKSL